jgi:ABC-type branched-subunit amino acid transport system ATPase component
MNIAASLPLDKGSPSEPLLVVKGLDVFYGRAHAVQSISFGLSEGVLGIVGRNGMGKTSLCNAITGLVPARGSIRFAGEEILGLSPDKITRRGIAYVPQGRRMWPSLTVDETLCLVGRTKHEVQEMYELFPRLAERKGNGSAQLSGGEQQMLAIARALLLRPRLLVMDEPTEGLAPVIVDHVVEIMRNLVADKGLAILLIEQNLGVALEVSGDIGVMVNGQIAHQMPASVLAADRDLQERLLGLRSADSDSDSDGHSEGDVNALPTLTGIEESRHEASAKLAE